MKMREEFTCPLELVHDMIKGKMETYYFMAVTSGADFPCKIGKRHRRHYTKNAIGATKRVNGFRFCGKAVF